MRVTVIGAGYVGLVTGTCLAETGHDVRCVDNNPAKIEALQRGNVPIYEPGLDKLIQTNVAANRLQFTSILSEALEQTDIVFIGVGTPTNPENGHADLRYVFAAAEEIAKNLNHAAIIVVKSTVPVGTGKKVAAIFASHCKYSCPIVSNPEFLREGSAIPDFMEPDRIVVGTDSPQAREAMQQLYRPFEDRGFPVIFMDKPESAELAKYACNAYLAMRISFVNEVSDMCEKMDANVRDVTRAMGLDKRIGPYFLKPGPGFGGSCFPKDTLALKQVADAVASPSEMVKAAILSNESRKKRMAHKIIQACHGDIKGKTIAILGLTFKADTNDMRESPSLVIVPELLKHGAVLKLYDPQGMTEAKALLTDKNLEWCDSAYEAMQGSDASVILTEWKEFAALDFTKARSAVNMPLIVDLRSILPEPQVKQAGFRYITLGKKEAIETNETDLVKKASPAG